MRKLIIVLLILGLCAPLTASSDSGRIYDTLRRKPIEPPYEDDDPPQPNSRPRPVRPGEMWWEVYRGPVTDAVVPPNEAGVAWSPEHYGWLILHRPFKYRRPMHIEAAQGALWRSVWVLDDREEVWMRFTSNCGWQEGAVYDVTIRAYEWGEDCFCIYNSVFTVKIPKVLMPCP